MRHVAVLAQPVGGFHNVPVFAVANYARRFPELRLRVLPLLRIQLVSVLVVRLFLVVHEEVDTRGEEVHRRSLEELVAAAASLFLAFLQGFQQSLGCLACRCKVVDVLRLDGVHPPAVFHIHEVDDVELAALWQLAQLLVLPVMIVQLGRQSGKLIVIHDHHEALGGMLPDERLDDGEGLSASRRADHPCTSERVADVHPSLTELALVVIAHRNVHAVVVLHFFLTLFEALVLEVKAVFHQPVLDVFRDIVKCHMNQYHACQGGCHIEDDVYGQRVQLHPHRMAEQPYGEDEQRKA